MRGNGYIPTVGPQTSASFWCEEGDSPIVAVALHAGHAVRDEVAALLALDEMQRLREEDPRTDDWTALAPTRLVVRRSRFEVDLNRPRDAAVYRRPEDAWGLNVWHSMPSAELVARSLAQYDAFYATLEGMLARAERRFGQFVVYDLHSYNYARSDPGAPADPASNPDINLGTGSMNRARWASVVDRFLADLRVAGEQGLDVRENVRFRGGHLCRWVHERFPETGCALAIEVKKFFMDEHTGAVDEARIEAVGRMLAATVSGVREELSRS